MSDDPFVAISSLLWIALKKLKSKVDHVVSKSNEREKATDI